MSETRDNQTLNCSDCESEAATGLCTTCQMKLCDFCTTHHQRSARYKDHVIQSVEGVSNEELFDKQPLRCADHNQEMKCFCESCQVSICVECMLSDTHRGHVFKSLDQVMKTEVKTLANLLEDAEEVTKNYNVYLESAKLFQEKSNEEREISKKLIEDTFNEFITLMEGEKQKLLRRVDAAYESSSAALSVAEQGLSHVERLRSFMKDIMKYPTSEVFDVMQSGTKRLSEASSMKNISSEISDVPKDLIFLPEESQMKESEDKYNLNLLARQVKIVQFARTKMVDQISSMKSLFIINESKFTQHSQALHLNLNNLSAICDRSIKYSDAVEYKGHLWRLLFRSSTNKDFAGIFIDCRPKSPSSKWNCTATIRIVLKNHLGKDLIRNSTHQFRQDDSDWGWVKFAFWKDLIDPTKGFIKNDSISISADIKVTK